MYPIPHKPFFALAPMDEVTDMVFRQIVGELAAPDIYFTEFVNVDGLQSPGRKNLLKKLAFSATEQTLIAQLWGLDPANFRLTAQQIADGSLARELHLPDGCNFIGVDLNMGCPAKSEVRNGACSALILNRPLAADIISATKQGLAGKLPISVKTRVGFNDVDISWLGFLLDQGIDMLTVHGRTRQQMSKVPANWELIGQVRELRDQQAPRTLLVGNGDVESREHGEQLAAQHGLDGIMIGRGIFHDPFVFSEQPIWDSYDRSQRIALYRRHIALFATTWQEGERHPQTLNKFCKVYINGFDGAKELRERLMVASSVSDSMAILAVAELESTNIKV